jgi:hypothetical protein
VSTITPLLLERLTSKAIHVDIGESARDSIIASNLDDHIRLVQCSLVFQFEGLI